MPETDMLIIGGGAAGLAAAVMLGRRLPERTITLLEKAPRVGRKLQATGNGTCNITNLDAASPHYHGGNPAFVQPALRAFSPQDAMAFFASIGVECAARAGGRVYPLCAQASAVLDCLRTELAALGVRTVTGCAVTALRRQGDGWLVETADGGYTAKQVLCTAGGAASPSLGGGTDGYTLLAALGHDKTPLFPAIVQIRTDREAVKAVKGVRVDAGLTLLLDGRPVAQATGEVLFADYGLSGPAAMQIGRVAADWERRKKGTMTAVLDLLPDCSDEQMAELLARRRRLRDRPLEELLTGLVQKRVGQTVLKAAGLSPLSRSASSLTEAEWQSVARTLRGWTLPVLGSAGFGAAQVTAGGIDTAGFDPHTMQSRHCAGLFAAGEVLDVDGDCGGFNLHWAWASAAAATAAMGDIL